MRTRLVALVALVTLVLAGVAGVALIGFGPTPGGDSDVGSSPTERPAPDDRSRGEDRSPRSASTKTPSETTPPPFAFRVDSMEPCGWTCRDVTSTMTNQQATAATDVTVAARISIGEEGGDVIWEGTATVGTLDAGESYTVTRRVQLTYGEGFAIRQEGGWVTVRTTVATNTWTRGSTARLIGAFPSVV